MKKIAAFILLVGSLIASSYTGFLKPHKGAWAKYEIIADNSSMQMTLKFLGTVQYKGKRLNVLESETSTQGGQFVSQFWSAVDNDAVLKKMITKTPQGIMCMEEQMIGMSGMSDQKPSYYTKTPKKFSPDKPNIKYATYTLPSGKKIPVAIFKDGSNEIWVSSKVPFGIVLVKKDGKPQMKLIDFGLSGAKAKIPIEEAKSCSPMALPFFLGQ